MRNLRKYVPLFVFIILLISIFIITGPALFNQPVKRSSAESLGVRTENDFAADPALVALPDEDIVAVLLESQDCNVLENDTGGKGYDIIPYRYESSMEQTFCWEDGNRGAGHYMVLVNDEGVEVLQVKANGECATGVVEPGDYEMRVYHDRETEKNVAVFVAPEEGKSTLSTASDGTINNVSTFLETDRCAGCDLSGANLFNADLSGVDLEGAKLNDAILANANLSGANLSGAELKNADLTGSNLSGAVLAGADLTNAVLINSDLSEADLTAANMEGADVTGAFFGDNVTPGALVTTAERDEIDTGGENEPGVDLDAETDLCRGGRLAPGDGTKDLLISARCDVPAGVFLYQNVNIIKNGVLIFADTGGETHFWAKSILVEAEGAILAGTPANPFGKNKGVLTIHLYGSEGDKTGITCKSPQATSSAPPCGVPKDIWDSNGGSEFTLPPGNVKDRFYKYVDHDNVQSETGFFGRKVLAVSYDGTLAFYGFKGAKYGDKIPNFDSGTSWVRLKNDKDATPEKTLINLDRDVDWEAGDRIVVTTTDYLPGHSEELQIVKKEGPRKLRVTIVDPATNMPPAGCVTDNPDAMKCGLRWVHNGDTYPDSGFNFQSDELKRLSLNVKLANGGEDNGKALAETRAAVALLTRSIRIVSAGDSIPTTDAGKTCKFDCFPTGFYGGQTMFRQGIKQVQVQGVEFHQLGQGGRKGRYPVHLHLLRKTPADTFVKDSSINESMTRWITLHGTQGATIARNVGWKSIGHGYYLEDGTETDNKLYSNIGIFARAAIQNVQNPRNVPGILAYTANKEVPNIVPFHSDYRQPAVFWIMNGWNDFEYNMAAGASACGICYWWLPGYISGMSQDQKWESYASQQSNGDRAGDTPLKNFKGNYCSSAMTAFNTTGDISICNGVGGPLDPQAPVLQPVTVGNVSPKPESDKSKEKYYPRLGNLHRPTFCNQTDCSTVKTCSAGERANCAVAVLDRFTTAFNWTETNFSAMWLRPQWYLVINSVISDVQNAGLTFVTGGDYTESNFIPGQWQLARQNVFIGQTQPNNPLASSAGPVNDSSSLKCARRKDNNAPVGNYCLLEDEGVAIQLSNFANNQRLFNIYDGPSFEDSNAFFDIKKTFFPNDKCNVGQGNCVNNTNSMYGGVPGMPYDKTKKQCFLPNAAIAWKQSNGFYYPPAFHSANLYFRNSVDIRHFVIEPLFEPGKFAFKSDDERVKTNYCTFALNNPEGLGGLFSNFSAIDRQTILNDDDGSLTGLKNTISVNEDPFFNAPTETIECESEGTARTSPYDYVTTVVYPGCVAKKDCGGVCKVDRKPCADTSNCAAIPNQDNSCDDSNAFWNSDCGSSFCYGVPLYRQFLTQSEANNTKGQEIRMMGMNFFQRSNLTANHGTYYIDTTVSDANQRAGLLLAPLQKPSLNVFKGGEEYYVVLIFAKDTTKQTYQIYVGTGRDSSTDEKFNSIVHGIRSPLKSSRPLDVTPISTWPSKWVRKYNATSGILEVTVDLSDFKTQFDNSKMDRCKPESFCTWTGSAATGSCGCSDKLKTSNPDLYAECTKTLGDNKNNICSWAVRAVDCPEGGCYGFSFTLTEDPPAEPIAPPAPCCFPDNADWNVKFSPVGKDIAGSCQDSNPPAPKFCTAPMCPTGL